MSEFLPLDTRTGKVRNTSSNAGTEDKPIDFSDVFVIGILGGGEISGITPLVNNQSYIDVFFPAAQPAADWTFLECRVVNTVDANPLNIWPGIVTSKTTSGFRLQLNGRPDSANYILSWTIKGTSTAPLPPATTYSLAGPVSGPISAPTTFIVQLPTDTSVSVPVTVTPSDGAGGTFAPTTVELTTALLPATFTYTPSSYGAKTISVTNDGGLSDPPSLSFLPLAATYLLSGPSGGNHDTTSTPFTVQLPAGAAISGSLLITPSDSGGGGSFTPTSVSLTNAAPSATFVYTPGAGLSGAKTISVTNSQGLTDPASLTYTISAPLADGAVIASWGDSSGHGNSAYQTVDNNKPTYRAAPSGYNGKPAVEFENSATVGFDQWLNLTTGLRVDNLAGNNPITILIVMSKSVANLVGLGSSTGDGVFFPTIYGGILYTGIGQAGPTGLIIAEASGPTGTHIYSESWDTTGSTLNFNIDGTLQTPSTTLPGGYGVLDSIGRRGAIEFSTGFIAEICYYNVVLSPTDLANVTKGLSTKYGVTVSSGGTAVAPDSVAGLQAWWKADSL